MKYAAFMPRYLAELDEIQRIHDVLAYLRRFKLLDTPKVEE